MKPTKARASERAVHLQAEYPHPPERVWKALTDPDALAAWLLPTTFQPRLGSRFSFTEKGRGGRRRKIHCQVVELNAPCRLAYTWQAEDETLPTLVAWTLEPTGEGTRLTLEHIGPAAPHFSAQEDLTCLALALEETAPDNATRPLPQLRIGRIVLSEAAHLRPCVSRRRTRSAVRQNASGFGRSIALRQTSTIKETLPCTR